MAGSGTAHLRRNVAAYEDARAGRAGNGNAGAGAGHADAEPRPLLLAEDLTVEYPVAGGRTLTAVGGVSFDVMEGETLGLVGESGCGKSSAARAVLQLPRPTAGEVWLDDVELTALDAESVRRLRPKLQMIHQDPISSLNPRRTVRDIVAEPLFVWWDEEDGRSVTSDWLERFGAFVARVAGWVLAPVRRVMPFAWAALLLWVLSEAVEERAWDGALGWTQVPAQVIGFPVLVVLVAAAAVLALLAAGWLLLTLMVPFGLASRHFGDVHPVVGTAAVAATCAAGAFLLVRTFDTFGGWAKVLNTGSLAVLTALLLGWTLVSVVRPANAGAAGLAAALAALLLLEAFYVAGLDDSPKLIVLVVSAAVDAALAVRVRRSYRRARATLRERAEPYVREALETVGINPDTTLDRKPHALSGGQAQRVSIARALVMEPSLIVCDEPVSALDVSVQAQILNLLEDMKQRLGLTLVFIAHDLAVVKNVSDRVAVMYLGKMCEVAAPDEMFADPAHPYTELLISAIPHPDPFSAGGGADGHEAADLGEMPSVLEPPSGCRFRTRCPHALPVCELQEPVMREVAPGRFVACHAPLIAEDLGAAGALSP